MQNQRKTYLIQIHYIAFPVKMTIIIPLQLNMVTMQIGMTVNSINIKNNIV
ncbi:hypothetical protein FB446DRAFT_679215, partial [Lentinula raphanica]